MNRRTFIAAGIASMAPPVPLTLAAAVPFAASNINIGFTSVYIKPGPLPPWATQWELVELPPVILDARPAEHTRHWLLG